MKKTLRLLLFEDCNRNCEGCCNKQWDLSKLPVVKDFTPYDTIILTGGEPMLYPHRVTSLIDIIRFENPKVKIILYTAMTTKLRELVSILNMIDGLTVTLHDQSDFAPLLCFDSLIYGIDKTLRLNVFEGVDMFDYELFSGWQIKENIEWLEDCPLPDNEVFMRL